MVRSKNKKWKVREGDLVKVSFFPNVHKERAKIISVKGRLSVDLKDGSMGFINEATDVTKIKKKK